MKTLTVNDKGLDFIKAMYGEHSSIDILEAGVYQVAEKIECGWNGEDPCFEIPSRESINGRPNIFYLPDDGYVIGKVEDDS